MRNRLRQSAIDVNFICATVARRACCYRDVLLLLLLLLSCFTQRVINSLPVHVVNSSSVNSFKNRPNLDRFWSNQEVYYNFRFDMLPKPETEV